MKTLQYITEVFFFSYGLLLFITYFLMAILAFIAIKKYNKSSTLIDETAVKGAKDLPSITLVAPAYNEGLTIITNVYSLLSLQYPNYELIVVNDGSNDNSLEKLIKEFELITVPYVQPVDYIETSVIVNLYKSNNPKYANLTLIDKENGGRADAINCGISIAKTNLILCTDADCIIEQGALLKMVRPYLEEGEEEIIACGGAIGIANDSVIYNGTLQEVKMPKKMITRIQVVEYMRSFLIGRMAWSEINGLMLVSGAFGMYPRKRLIEVGGFDRHTVGEDLELCIRLRKHMEEIDKPYKVVYLPDTLCWTEAPSTYKIYISQRDRWSRGLAETMGIHKQLFLNKKYGIMGKVLFPYWLLFEYGAPLIEFLGLLNILFFAFYGNINWLFTLSLIACVYLAGCAFSTLAVLFHISNYKHYSKISYIIKLLCATYLESFIAHPVMLYAQIKGLTKMLFGVKSTWGTMTRTGF